MSILPTENCKVVANTTERNGIELFFDNKTGLFYDDKGEYNYYDTDEKIVSHSIIKDFKLRGSDNYLEFNIYNENTIRMQIKNVKLALKQIDKIKDKLLKLEV